VHKLNDRFIHPTVSEATKDVENLCDNSFSFMCVRLCDEIDSILYIKSDAEGFDYISPKNTTFFNPCTYNTHI